MASTGTAKLAAAIAYSKNALSITTGTPVPALASACIASTANLASTGTHARANAAVKKQLPASPVTTGRSSHARANAYSRLPQSLLNTRLIVSGSTLMTVTGSLFPWTAHQASTGTKMLMSASTSTRNAHTRTHGTTTTESASATPQLLAATQMIFSTNAQTLLVTSGTAPAANANSALHSPARTSTVALHSGIPTAVNASASRGETAATQSSTSILAIARDEIKQVCL